MTRLVVTADAEADFDRIIAYLQREAGARVADDYDRHIRAAIERLVELPRAARRARSLVGTFALPWCYLIS
jgi:plasmid stabilization system protein ParE